MVDYSIKNILTVSMIIIIIINLIAVVGIGIYVYNKTVEISHTLSKNNDVLLQMESTLDTLNDLPNKFESINSELEKIKEGQDLTNDELLELSRIKKEISTLNEQIQNITINLINLENKYPPSQNLYFNNISEYSINSAIDNSIEKRFTKVERKINNFYWTLFGTLFGIGLISLGITIFNIYRKKA